MRIASLNNKTSIALLAAVIALTVVIAALLLWHFTGLQYKGNISVIEITEQEGNSITFKNYTIVLKEDFDWDKASENDRIGTAKYAVKKATKLALKAEAGNYNVIGLTNKDRQPVFLYVNGGNISLYLNGVNDQEIKQ
jgi:hypothetical protein